MDELLSLGELSLCILMLKYVEVRLNMLYPWDHHSFPKLWIFIEFFLYFPISQKILWRHFKVYGSYFSSRYVFIDRGMLRVYAMSYL